MSRGIVFIEGNKGTFKGTVIGELLKDYQMTVVKGIPKGDPALLNSYKNPLDGGMFLLNFWKEILRMSEKEIIITDRCYMSNQVYNGTFPDVNRQFVYLSEEQRLELEHEILKNPYALIYLHDTIEKLWDRYTLRGTHDIVKTDFIQSIDEIKTLNEKFEDFISNKTILDYLSVDCSEFCPQNPEIIRRYLRERTII